MKFCWFVVTLFLLVTYFIADISLNYFSFLFRKMILASSNLKHIYNSPSLPPVCIQRTRSKFLPRSKFREISLGSCSWLRGPGSCRRVLRSYFSDLPRLIYIHQQWKEKIYWQCFKNVLVRQMVICVVF